jgi:prepilin-type N-terminal cleavage/methylation domain-containing protein
MTFASIGTQAVLRSRRPIRNSRAGFTLLEALVALALLLTFAATLNPLLHQARRIMENADRRVAANMLLRSVLATPVDRASLANLSREGETGGLHWQIAAQPMAAPALPVNLSKPKPKAADQKASKEQTDWAPYLVTASVTWARGRTLSAETVRLGKAE